MEQAFLELDSIGKYAVHFKVKMSELPRHGFKGGASKRTMLYFDGHAEISTKRLQEQANTGICLSW